MKKSLILIPARYASTRFPAKPLAILGGKPVIQWVVEQASRICPMVYVATDDERIASCVQGFGANALLTSAHHASGTDRIIEAYSKLELEVDIVVNLQGDEPFVRPEQIRTLLKAFDDDATQIATLCEPFAPDSPDAELLNPNTVKLLRSPDGWALYFSRSRIPYLRGIEADYCRYHRYYRHIGLYAFRASVLRELAQLSQSLLEQAESLEQLRWLEAGYRIKVMETTNATIGIDTPEDLERAERYLHCITSF